MAANDSGLALAGLIYENFRRRPTTNYFLLMAEPARKG
jgi:hypothetical protein